MAKNPQPSRPNRNHIYVGTSGSGKSQAAKQNPEIPAQGARVILWDPDEDYKATRYRDRKEFGRAVLAGLRSGRGFRIAYTCEAEDDQFIAHHEWWCQFVYSVLDGRHLTYVIDDEVAASCSSTAKADPAHGKLLRQGRKYGMVYHCATQYPQEIPKTVYRNCPVLWVGRSFFESESNYVPKQVRKSTRDLEALGDLQFWVRDHTQPEPIRFEKLTYKNI